MKSLMSAFVFFGSVASRALPTPVSEFEVVASYTVASLFVGDFICDEKLCGVEDSNPPTAVDSDWLWLFCEGNIDLGRVSVHA